MKPTNYYDENYEEEEEPKYVNSGTGQKKSNILPLWGNERTMNLNPLILTNIQSSHYFKVNLYGLKTYHEVIDEIYYKVAHLEPWEKGSRKTAGQTGMCGGVRGVGAGGIVSTAYCLLFKLFTLKLTRKQLNGLITHPDSPYIRALGFMYIRYTQPPPDLWDWYDEYLEDSEELDVKAGGGQVMTIGNILKTFLCKLEWFSTLFPRIPVPIQQKIERNMALRFPSGIGTQKSTAVRRSTDTEYNEVDKTRHYNPLKDRRIEDDGRLRDDRRRGHSPERHSNDRDKRWKHHSHDRGRYRHGEEKRRHRSRSRSRSRHRHRH
ncbi:pre-mRNA-splicing factor 38B isoform X1 [Cimex lectularius]|uniref:Pre-mRNA-splicing factor 38 n=1 Tax=Cimex lectularius TaxID=79782 RepID=A0A8I6RT99_CIMLE|nr:pre-mRNA-splicing factor 38B isoform X1 [Cimex lectularius]